MDTALGAIAALSRSGALDPEIESHAISRILQRDSNVLLIAKHFGASPRFAQHLSTALAAPSSPLDVLGITTSTGGPPPTVFESPATVTFKTVASKTVTPATVTSTAVAPSIPDALIIGTGAAGLTAALRLLDAGGNVVLMDKEKRTGGNSAKASSGINAVLPPPGINGTGGAGDPVWGTGSGDSVEAFTADTAKSAKRPSDGLISLLASSSGDAVRWLMDRTGIDLSLVAQLGGHSFPRTHRPANGMVGSELTVALARAVRKFEATGQLRMMLGCRVTGLQVRLHNKTQNRHTAHRHKDLRRGRGHHTGQLEAQALLPHNIGGHPPRLLPASPSLQMKKVRDPPTSLAHTRPPTPVTGGARHRSRHGRDLH
jgi:hypothetical protein